MAVTPEQVAAREAAERYAQAQAHAYRWMARAQREEEQADHVVEHERSRQGWPGIATRHRKDADRAMTFARAWARVAAVLVPPPEPLELVQAEVQSIDLLNKHTGQSDLI